MNIKAEVGRWQLTVDWKCAEKKISAPCSLFPALRSRLTQNKRPGAVAPLPALLSSDCLVSRLTGSPALRLYPYAMAVLARSHRTVKAAGSLMAISARAFLFRVISAFLRPSMNRL